MKKQLSLFDYKPPQPLDASIIEMMKSEDFKAVAMQLAIGKGWSQKKAFKEICKQNFTIDTNKWFTSVVEEASSYYFLDFTIANVRFRYFDERDVGFWLSGYKNGQAVKGFDFFIFDWGIDDTYSYEFALKIRKKLYRSIDVYWELIRELLN